MVRLSQQDGNGPFSGIISFGQGYPQVIEKKSTEPNCYRLDMNREVSTLGDSVLAPSWTPAVRVCLVL